MKQIINFYHKFYLQIYCRRCHCPEGIRVRFLTIARRRIAGSTQPWLLARRSHPSSGRRRLRRHRALLSGQLSLEQHLRRPKASNAAAAHSQTDGGGGSREMRCRQGGGSRETRCRQGGLPPPPRARSFPVVSPPPIATNATRQSRPDGGEGRGSSILFGSHCGRGIRGKLI
jgi:hypothetical protein